MINNIKVVLGTKFDPYHNLAVEEYLTMSVKKGEIILYLWQNQHTIVIGRNQNVWQECKVDEFLQDKGKLVRRLSGGGAVYHDLGNLNFTFCVNKQDYDVDKQLSVILNAVKLLGINAEKTGRNDITIEQKKFSGNAFYKQGDCCYHHGTLLLNVDSNQLAKYLNVDKKKLLSKGVTSVRSRVANLKEYNPNITVKLMQEKLKEAMVKVYNCPIKELLDSSLAIEDIEPLQEKFSDWQWIFGRKIQFTNHLQERFAWGNIEFCIGVNEGKIKTLKIYSDAMEQDLILKLQDILNGCIYKKVEIIERIKNIDRENISFEQQQNIIDLINSDL